MRFLILNTDYPGFLAWLYAQNPGLAQKSYDEQMHVRMESLFGVANFYSSNLRRLGHEAWDIYINNEFMQKRWGYEHGLQRDQRASSTVGDTVFNYAATIAANTPLRTLKPILKRFALSLNGSLTCVDEILAAQIEHYQPDVVLNQAMDGSIGHFLKRMKPHFRLLVGQIASPLPKGNDVACYDLIISSLPNFVEYFRQLGVAAELHLFGFEPDILNKLDCEEKSIPVSFVGGVSRDHASRTQWLEYLCRTTEIEVWGYGVETLPGDSCIRKRYRGTAWGIEMYRVLRRSKITLNYHIGVASCYANNMRLFEAAGVGCLLVTDWKVNLQDILAIGNQVLAYRRPAECAETITYYLENEPQRKSIARAGQVRVLKEHTYARRMDELVQIVGKYS